MVVHYYAGLDLYSQNFYSLAHLPEYLSGKTKKRPNLCSDVFEIESGERLN